MKQETMIPGRGEKEGKYDQSIRYTQKCHSKTKDFVQLIHALKKKDN